MQAVESKFQNQRSKTELFEFQNWDVYQRSIKMVTQCRSISNQNKAIGIKGFNDQLTRASLSIPLNIAEGISRFGVKEKLNFLRVAKGSVFECVACLDVLFDLECLEISEYRKLVKELSEIGKMLSGLIRAVKERDSKD